MSESNNNHDLFSASLESIESSKRVEKFERFKNDSQRDYVATLNNAQEWIKAELPIVTDYIDASAVKEELKQSKISSRRKHLLSSLLFEKKLREAVDNNNADTAAMMAIHMFNHMWQAKVELQGGAPVTHPNLSSVSNSTVDSAVKTYDDTNNDSNKKILTTLIEKSEKLQKDSQIQSKIEATEKANSSIQKIEQDKIGKSPKLQKPSTNSKPNFSANKSNNDIWEQESNAVSEQNRFSKTKVKKSKKKANGMLERVKTKIPLKRKRKSTPVAHSTKNKNPAPPSPEDSLLDDPNRSAIHVSAGFADSIDDSIIKARAEMINDPNASGVTVHKVLKSPNESGVTVHKSLKERDHDKQEPGSNTIIMKLASSSRKRPQGKLSVPEQCQEAINLLTQQFPGYDMVAIRHMAAEKVGVSPQYIENLNILPDKSA